MSSPFLTLGRSALLGRGDPGLKRWASAAETALDKALAAVFGAGGYVAQPDLTDLTSIFQSDGSGNPSIGDSIDGATILDTSQFGGKTAAEFIASQTNLAETAEFVDSSTGTGTATRSGNTITINSNDSSNYGFGRFNWTLTPGKTYILEVSITGANQLVYINPTFAVTGAAARNFFNNETKKYILTATGISGGITVQSGGNNAGTGTATISLVEIPGNHITAAGTGPTIAGTDNGERGPELVTNGGFDTDSDWTKDAGWTISGGKAVATSAAYPQGIFQVFAWEIGAEYEITYDVSGLDGINGGVTAIAAGELLINNDKNNGTKTVKFQASVSQGVIIRAGDGGLNTTCTIDNISVKKVGQLPYIETNGTDDKLTLPLPARRNLLTYSEDLPNAAWNRDNNTVSGGLADPLGGHNAQRLTSTTDSAWSRAWQGDGGAIGTSEAFVGSVWLRSDAPFTASIRLRDSSGELAVSNVAVTTTWQRFEITATSGASSTSTDMHVFINADAVAGTATSGQTLDVFGAQLEAGSSATDYQRITSDHLADTSITMAVRTSDTEGILVDGQGTNRYIGAIDDGNMSATLNAGAGTPAYRLDGAAFSPASQDVMHTNVANGDWHVVTISAADLSSWTSIVLGFFDSAHIFNTEYDLAHFSIYPDDSATRDLAEAAAADAIRKTGYEIG